MDYKKLGHTVFVRIDRGEELHSALKEVALKENITLAHVRGLGATDSFTVGVYKVGEKKYYSNHFEGDYEIVSLTGTITTMNGEYYPHIHMSAGDEKGHVVGGHLNQAMISVTCEVVVQMVEGKVERSLDEEIGINLFDFTK